jgi:uncharacterized protein (TIGR01777 family)
MNILISGASGLIGKALTSYLSLHGHQVYTLRRNSSGEAFSWQPNSAEIHLDPNITLDAVINLNGVNIADKPWSEHRKQDIITSRINSTRLLAATMAQLKHPPKVFINASAIGYYGDTGSQAVDESGPAGDNFLTEIVSLWESSAQASIDAGIRTVFIRSGIVLSPQGGALAKMLMPYKFGLGGKLGNGEQVMSWISLEDEVRGIEFILNNDSISGAVNLTSPSPVTNSQFSEILANVLNRPALLPLPEFLIKLLFGEMGELLLLGSCKAMPMVLLDNNFEFHHPQLEPALKQLL